MSPMATSPAVAAVSPHATAAYMQSGTPTIAATAPATTLVAQDSTAAPATTIGQANTSDPAPAAQPEVTETVTPSSAGSTNTCSGSPSIRITEVDVGTDVFTTEDEVSLTPLVITPRSTASNAGSLIAFKSSTTGNVHILRLLADDTIDSSFAVAQVSVNDFADAHTDDNDGFVLLATRDATGGGTLNCGNPSNLCGVTPDPAIPCYSMDLIHFDQSGAETWATTLTDTNYPPYSTSATGPNVVFVWWYAHHGRLAYDGTNFAAYFGAAISVSQGGCINIHQGDRMKVVDPTGAIVNGGFDWGCSHSGYERVTWDNTAGAFVGICKTDNNNQIMFPDTYGSIYPVDLWYSDLGDVVTDGAGAYWTIVSNARAGQPAETDGLADVHLVHFSRSGASDDIVLASDAGINDRAPHLALFGSSQMLAVWETSSAVGELQFEDSGRTMFVQLLDRASGSTLGSPISVDKTIAGNRYQAFTSFPDGSVAYLAPGSTSTKLKILRISPSC
ncbi:hypothetical protein HDU84_005554 [Entophlyctis sp. JEL0112]|nr:hypothetical protein HDU84_005554 [Entophlyctis sp. JEL0112]